MEQELQKCISSLPDVKILNDSEKKLLLDRVESRIEFSASGIVWDSYPHYIHFYPNEPITVNNTFCYIIWDEYTLPVLRTNLRDALSQLDLITIMAFNTWIIGSELDWVIEFHHEEEESRMTLL